MEKDQVCAYNDKVFEMAVKAATAPDGKNASNCEILHWECLKVSLQPMQMTEWEILQNCEIRQIIKLEKVPKQGVGKSEKPKKGTSVDYDIQVLEFSDP